MRRATAPAEYDKSLQIESKQKEMATGTDRDFYSTLVMMRIL